MKVAIIIPARLASTRFPEKPLALIGNQTMIQRVYNQALKVANADAVVVATDHQKIYNHIVDFGGNVVLTDPQLPSGTDRVFAAAQSLNQSFDVIVNLQGDEPFINPQVIEALIAEFRNPEVHIATMASKIADIEEVMNPNLVKIVLSDDHSALYFSRSPIPYLRGVNQADWLNYGIFYQHIGLYAYRMETLEKLVALEQSPLEKMESLEQLRWLQAGYKIKVSLTDYKSFGIDTPEDLLKAMQIFNL